MTEVLARPARDFDVGDFTDITGVVATRIAWADGGQLRVAFDVNLTTAEVAAVRRRIQSANTAEETLREQAEAFIAADPASVTLVQLVRAVQRLARIVLRDL